MKTKLQAEEVKAILSTQAPSAGALEAVQFQRHASHDIVVAQSQRITQLNTYTAIANGAPAVQRQAAQGGLPSQLQSGIENLSGMSMGDVRVHYNSGKPAQLQAHAFAQGSDIHLAPGQEKHLPHEAWHVVQQKQGRVKPTLQLKGVAINDSNELEREADTMGARAMAGGGQKVDSQKINTQQNMEQPMQRMVIQRQLIDVAVTGITHLVMMMRNGSLYNPRYLDNEGQEVHEGDYVEIEEASLIFSRRGPNQETYAAHDGDKKPLYGWYKVSRLNGVAVDEDTYIRQDTIRNLDESDDRNRPLRSTIYGMDGISPQNFQEAYDMGYRDFDAAWSYRKVPILDVLGAAKLNKGPIRLIYKYRVKEIDDAVKELDALSAIKNVIIHTIMLHEIPDRKLDEAIQGLKAISSRYGAKAGLSNVSQLQIQSQENLSSLIEKASANDMRISTVENRMSPASPDDAVRTVCKAHGISYLAYGVQGPTGDNLGTCSMTATSTVEDYPVGKDPILREVVVNMLHLPEGDIRFFLLQWARRKGVSVISVSRSPEGMFNMAQSGFYNELYAFICEYEETNTMVAEEDDPKRFYTPFRRYLALLDLSPDVVSPLLTIVAPPIWRQYYKHILSKEKDQSSFVRAVRSVRTGEQLRALEALLTYEHVEDVTKLDNTFTIFLEGKRAGYRDQAEVYGAKLTTHQMIGFIGTKHAQKDVLLIDGGGDMKGQVAELQVMEANDILFIMAGPEKLATYKKDADGNWVKQ